MKLEQCLWNKNTGWSEETRSPHSLNGKADLIFLFGDMGFVNDKSILEEIKSRYPKAFLLGCSTAGEILGDHVYDDTVVVTAIQFSKTNTHHATILLSEVKNCFEAGERLANTIPHENLKHVFVLSVGLNVNGTDLVKGLSSRLPAQVSISGGLAGDKARFQKTVVVAGDLISDQAIAVVGLYGNNLQIGTASLGGWDAFGPERLVTKSKGNVLYELDGKSALELYKTYLGDHAKELPGSALLFPLCFRSEQSPTGFVRTILGVDEKEQSMTFAGDVPEGSYGRFMKANFDRLIEGAVGAAKTSAGPIRNSKPQLALLISCVGRKLVLAQRTEEEIEGVREVLGKQATMTGFYSYGEISPFTPSAKCELHNQTMTITTISETDEAVS
jgi:hypothetical protein